MPYKPTSNIPGAQTNINSMYGGWTNSGLDQNSINRLAQNINVGYGAPGAQVEPVGISQVNVDGTWKNVPIWPGQQNAMANVGTQSNIAPPSPMTFDTGGVVRQAALPQATNASDYYNAIGTAAYQGSQAAPLTMGSFTQAASGTRPGATGGTGRAGSTSASTTGASTPGYTQVPGFNPGSTATLSTARDINYNPSYWQMDPTNNPYINQSGAFAYDALPGMANTLNQYLSEGMGNAFGTNNALTGYLAQALAQGYPQGMSDYIQNMVNQQGATGANLMGGQYNFLSNQFQPWMNADLQTLVQYGLPNQELINALAGPQAAYGEGQQGAAAGTAAGLGAGQAPQTDLQSQLSGQLSQLMQGSGLTPGYVQAARETILQPSQENVTGQINRMSGGQMAPSSGLAQELLRRNESDFNNYLVQQGLQNLGGYMGQANTLGGQTFGQGLNLAGLQSDMGQRGIQNALNAYGSNQLGLNALSTASNLAYNPLTTGSNLINSATGTGSNLLNQYMGGMLGLQGNVSNQMLGLGSQYGDFTSDMLRNYLQNLVISQGQEGMDAEGWGRLAAQLVGSYFGGGG